MSIFRLAVDIFLKTKSRWTEGYAVRLVGSVRYCVLRAPETRKTITVKRYQQKLVKFQSAFLEKGQLVTKDAVRWLSLTTVHHASFSFGTALLRATEIVDDIPPSVSIVPCSFRLPYVFANGSSIYGAEFSFLRESEILA